MGVQTGSVRLEVKKMRVRKRKMKRKTMTQLASLRLFTSADYSATES